MQPEQQPQQQPQPPAGAPELEQPRGELEEHGGELEEHGEELEQHGGELEESGGAPEPGPPGGAAPEQNEPQAGGRAAQLLRIVAPLAVGAAAVVATPVVVGALGFGAGGIAAGSLAAKGMSVAATTGYGMPIVSVLQSVGAAGLSLSGGATVSGVAATLTAGVQKLGVDRLFRWRREPQ